VTALAAPIISPCVKICVLDRTRGICIGCERTLNEIATWGTMEEAARDRIMTALPERKLVREAALNRISQQQQQQ
jgi:predicted Fe-S protein YdhL (DUF1289 family)